MLSSTYMRSLLQSGSRRFSNSERRRSPQNPESFSIEILEAREMLTAGIGLQAQYFSATELSDPAVVRIDPQIDFNWGAESAAPAISTDHFSVRWSGQVEATLTETHIFTVTSNDDVRLWVNGQLLVDQSTSAVSTGAIDLIAGQRYDIELEYVEESSDAAIRLDWQSESLPQQVNPTQQLFPAARGTVSVERFSVDADSPASTFSTSSFETTTNDHHTSERISGWLHATETGPYRFFIAADGQAELWLSNSDDDAGKRKIAEVSTPTAPQDFTAAPEQQAAIVYLVEGQSYYIEAVHTDPAGISHLAVGWIPPEHTTISVIPGAQLSPVRPTVRIYADAASTAEGSADAATFTIVRSGGFTDAPLTVNYSTRGTAVNAVDYASLSGSITIPAGERSATLQLTALADSLTEGTETATIELQAGNGYQVGLISERTAHARLQDNAASPAGSVTVWTAPDLNEISHFGGNFTTAHDVNVGDVIQAEINVLPEDAYSAQLTSPLRGSVASGDILLLEFYARSVGTDAEFSAVFEQNGGEYTKSLIQGVGVGSQWSKVQIPFVAAENYATGEATFGFHLGQQIQTVQFAALHILNYGQPQSMISEADLSVYQADGVWGTGQSVAITGQSFPIAYQIETSTVPPEAWQLQAYQRNGTGIDSGESMRIEFTARAASPAAQAEFLLQRTDTFDRLISDAFSLSTDWQTFAYDFTVDESFNPNDLQIAFDVGFGRQTIQIGGITWKNISHQLDLTDLPSQLPAANYGGRSGTDTWRTDADSRIETERKDTVTVNVLDANGANVDGALVTVRQNEHAFQFGSAISALDDNLATNATDQSLTYQSEITRLFNTVVVENSLKWPRFEDSRQLAIDGTDFATENDLYLRGHNIVWPSRENMPASVWNEYNARVFTDGDIAAEDWLEGEIERRVLDMVTTFSGIVDEWDVVNEPFDNHDVMDVLGNEVVVDWYRQVREANPEALLTLNDYDIFSSNGNNAEHRANFDSWLTTLIAADLLDTIGEQGHYNDGNLTDISVLGQLISSYSTDFQTPIAITEFDVDSLDQQLQADYLRDYLTMSFSQPGVSKFVQWGFWESAHYLPQAALYREDFSIKPNGQVYEDLVFGNWWTDVRGTTIDGEFTTAAFKGNYDVLVEYNGQIYTATAAVDGSGTSQVTLELPIVTTQDEFPVLESASMSPTMAMPLQVHTPAEPSSTEQAIGNAEQTVDGIVGDADEVWQDVEDELESLFPVDEIEDNIETVTEIVDNLDAVDEVLETVGDWLNIF